MPPKRRRTAADEAEPEGEDEGDVSAANLRLSAKSTAVPAKRSQLKSLPSKHTTSYGSPAPVLPLQGSGAYGSDLRGATRDIFAAVRRDNKKAKLMHEAAQRDEPSESSRVTRARSRQASRGPTPVPEEESQSESEAEPSNPPSAKRPPPITSDEVEAELRALQARRIERERKKQEEEERREREQRERALRQQKEREDRERAEREERERVAREQREREAQERAKKEEKQRADRERAERKEKERVAREARERARKEEQEVAQREQQARVEREKRERAEQEDRERAVKEAERVEQERIERERREQEARQQNEAEEQTQQGRQEGRPSSFDEEAPGVRTQAEFERLMARTAKQQQEGARAATGEASAPNPEYPAPKKRTGDEFLDELFTSPKRPRSSDQTPSAAHLAGARRNVVQPPPSAAVSMRSYIEESHVFRDADVQTPTPFSMANTPSRAPLSGEAASGATLQPAVAQAAPDLRASNRPGAQDVWRFGMPPPRAPPRLPPPQAEPSRDPEVQQQAGRSRRTADSRSQQIEQDDEDEPRDGPSVTPRRSTRQARLKLGHPPATRNRPAEDPPVDEEPDERHRRGPSDDESPSDLEPPSPHDGKDGHDQPRQISSLRLRQENGTIRNGPPPDDSSPPDDDSSMADQFRRAWKDWRHYLWQVLRWVGYALMFLLTLNSAFFLWHRIGGSDWDTRTAYGLEWHGWDHMGRNIGQFIPYELRHPLGFLDDAEYSALQEHIYAQDGRISKLTDQTNDVRQATRKLEGILPQVVSVKQDKSTSRLVIQQDFWHALKDLIHAERSILTLERGKDGMNNISDEHWLALLKRLKAQGVLTSKEVDGYVQGAVSRSWETWLKKNRGQVDKVLGTSPGKPLSPEAEKQIENLIRAKVSGPGLRDIVVTREEFIREVEKSINVHKRETQAELAQVQDSLRAMIEAASSSGGMTRQEVVTLTNDLVAKAISNARLEGAAKGNINANFEADLSRRINYFAPGNGATIEKTLTSPPYRPAHEKLSFGAMFGSEEWRKAKISAPRYAQHEMAALTAWEEAGQCWCAGARFEAASTSTGGPSQPADINVRLARSVVPENVVVEHIDPAATLDGRAMPKDVEVWALVDEYSRHRRVRDFMLASWPDTPRDHPLIGRGYLKIGEFRYDYDPATRGVVVYRVSEELRALGVSTDLVLVRAVSNYGADHTCFYRVRLYGSPVEGEAEVDGQRDEL